MLIFSSIFSNRFIILALMFKSINPSLINSFCIWSEVEVEVYFFTDAIVLEQFLIKIFLLSFSSIGLLWHFCQKIMTGRFCFWTLHFMSLIYLSKFIPVSHCLNYYSIIRSLEIKYCKSSNFVILKITLDGLVSLHLHINFRVRLSISKIKIK